MDNLEKALCCEIEFERGHCEPDSCKCCDNYQEEYSSADVVMDAAINRIHQLEKSNRNWRRKAQRLRKELKEVECEN